MRCDYCGGKGQTDEWDDDPFETCEECSGVGGWCDLCRERSAEDECGDCAEDAIQIAAE